MHLLLLLQGQALPQYVTAPELSIACKIEALPAEGGRPRLEVRKLDQATVHPPGPLSLPFLNRLRGCTFATLVGASQP